MSNLNYLRIAQLLGGTLTKTRTPVFGGFGIGETAMERFRLMVDEADPKASEISRTQYSEIVAAFEKVREGYELDRVLVDPVLRDRFIEECRRAGILASPKAIFKRLQGFRKSPPPGIKLKRTTRAAGLNVERYFYAAELAYTQLFYRTGVSVDDIITEPEVGDEFDELCLNIAPGGRSPEFRWAALRLRKMRSFSPKRLEQLLAITPSRIEDKLHDVGTLDQLDPCRLPDENGLFAFTERDSESRYLYVGSSSSVRDGVAPFKDAQPFRAIAGEFWVPELNRIAVSYAVVKKKLMGVSARHLGMRLIRDRHPIFNMPVEISKAA
ncbi:MAG: hypothetical protein ACM359_00575 [Bacillota bacterium]